LSIVISDDQRRARRLPTLFLGRSEFVVARDAHIVVDAAADAIAKIRKADSTATYAITPIEYDGIKGLYSKDLLNRSRFRFKLQQAGVKFAEDRFVSFLDDGSFACDSWGAFEPRFVIPSEHDLREPSQPVRVPLGILVFTTSSFRVGMIGPQELHRLVAALQTVHALGGQDAGRLVGALAQLLESASIP
jgi:hypothetical protein